MKKGKNAGDVKSSSMSWGVLAITCIAAFILVFDTTAMTVAISDLVKDLNTDISTIQAVMAIYTLVMASLMMGGAKLGDIIGRKRAFLIGVVIYGVGTLTAAISPNVMVLLTGWSFLEGIGAAIMMPAVVALIASSYEDARNRAVAYAVWAGVSAGAVAVGPILSGLIITALSWRCVFAGEVVLVLVILIFSDLLKEVPIDASRRPSLDTMGILISGVSLTLIILAFLCAKTHGWFYAKQPLVLGGMEIAPFGLSITPILLLAGIILFACFRLWTERRKRKNKTPLVDFVIFTNRTFLFGTITSLTVNCTLMGMMFILPVYLQLALHCTAFETGIYLIPVSFSILLISFVTGPISQRVNTKYLLIVGFIIGLVGLFILQNLFAGSAVVTGSDLAFGLTVFSVGVGIDLAILANVTISSIKKEQESEGSGILTSFRNLGYSMGTAILGTVLITFMLSGIATGLLASDVINVDHTSKKELIADLQDYVQKMKQEHSTIDLSQYPKEEANELVRIVASATRYTMRRSFWVIFMILAIALIFSFFIPIEKQR
jgi:MFS family permease